MDETNCANGVPKCSCGGTIKPDVVLYEEALNDECVNGAVRAISEADTLIIGGTSLVVYPAAALVNFTKKGAPIFYIDPKPSTVSYLDNITYIAKKATEGMTELAEILRKITSN
jgi:NAD-dependent SIR2 family protein deacetylase